MRVLLRWLLLPLLLLLLGVTALLLAAHLQVRLVSPPLPTLEEITDVTDRGQGPVEVAVLVTATQTSPLGTLGHPAVVLSWADGRRFLIDTGMPPAAAQAFGKPMEWLLDAAPTETFGGAASQLGAALDSVRGIAFTHLHSDHTDGLVAICAGQGEHPAVVFQTTEQASTINHTTRPGDDAIKASNCGRQRVSGSGVLRVRGFPGLAVVPLGGHTPGSTLYAVRSAGRLWLFSGDITNDKRSVDEDLPKPLVYSLLVVPEDTARTARLRRWLAELDSVADVVVLPAHDVVAMADAGLPAWSAADRELVESR